MKKGLQSGDKQFSLMLLSPAVIITVIFILVPVVDSIYRSFFDYKVKNIIVAYKVRQKTSLLPKNCTPNSSLCNIFSKERQIESSIFRYFDLLPRSLVDLLTC